MSVNQQRKNAMKRLGQDLVELENQPVENVSAAPMDDNMLEWHCNFKHDDIIYHLILFFPDKYPYDSPSAEFVPNGFRYNSGATKPGKKGTKVCLNIFSDFADIHTEWKDQKGLGWSPGYTVQAILMNVVAFLAETQTGEHSWMKEASKHNKQLSRNFKCDDCGHTYSKPFPPLDAVAKAPKVKKQEPKGPQIIDYISKESFKAEKPKSDGDLYGYGLIVSGPPHRPALTSPCEFLTLDSFTGMKKAMGKVHSVMKEEVKYFLPMYIQPKHGEEIKATVEKTLMELADLLPGCSPKTTSMEEMVLKTIPNLMSATVVEFSKGTQHTSDNSLNGYFALHRLFLWALETYPGLEKLANDRLKEFIDNVDKRTKKACPHIGEWLLLLTGSWKYRWQDAADAYLSESWQRQVMWYVKDDAKLGFLDTDQEYRLRESLTRTAVSRKLLAFQVLFLDIAMPKGKSRQDLIRRYDANSGFPTDEMVKQMKQSIELIESMKTFTDWFKVLKLKPPSDEEIFDKLVEAVEFSINTEGYHWSFPRGAGGWTQVLAKYKGKAKAADKERKGKGKGKGPKEAPAPKAPAKGRGRGKKAEPMEVESDSEEEEVKPKGRGRGRGKKSAEEAFGTKKPGRGGKRRK